MTYNKKIALKAFQVLTACLLFAACTDESFVNPPVVEGLPASLNLNVITSAPTQVNTRASNEVETNVEHLAFLFYKSENSKPIIYQPASLGDPIKVEDTWYKYSITIPQEAGLTSGNWYIYAIANWNKGFWNNLQLTDLQNMTKAEIDKYNILKMSDRFNIIATSALLTGKYQDAKGQTTQLSLTADEAGGQNKLEFPLQLRRSYAKVIFRFHNGNGVKFVPDKWDIYNYCRTSTLFERNGWTFKDGATTDSQERASELFGTFPGTLTWSGVEEGTAFRDGTDFPLYNSTMNGVRMDSLEFYIPENVQKAKGNPGSIAMREHMNGADTYTYAPDKSTYIIVHGSYEGPGLDGNGTVTGDVHYKIHLGDISKNGSFDNFTVRRNTKYTYDVTVNGVDNIIIKATTDADNQPGAWGNIVAGNEASVRTLDAHYDETIISIPKATLDAMKDLYTIQLRVPGIDKTYNNVNDIPEEEANWLEFCASASEKTYQSYYQATKYTLKDLITAIQNGEYRTTNANYNKALFFTTESDPNVYIQIFANEFYYEKYKNDLSKFVNVPDRIINIATGVQTNNNSSYTLTPIFTIRQQSIKTVFDLNNAENPFGLENSADNANKTQVVFAASKSDSYQDCSDLYSDDPAANAQTRGRLNTLAILQQLREEHGGELRWSEVMDYTNYRLKSEYDYGVYRWLTRNRDLNANDIVDDEEVRWYLPSVYQHQCIWAGIHTLPMDMRPTNDQNYYTSTKGDYRTFWANEGTYGMYKYNSNETGEAVQFVRCFRTLKEISAPTSTVSTLLDGGDGIGKRVISVNGLGLNALRRSGTLRGEYQYHNQESEVNKLPDAFLVAENYLAIGGDGYVPKVSVTNVNGKRNGIFSWKYTYIVTFDVNIKRKAGRRYYYNRKASMDGATELLEGELTNQNIGTSDGDLYILTDNGNYVQLTHTTGENPNVTERHTITTGAKINFTLTEATTQNLCADYYENPDGSDKGLWRIPNQRELMLMLIKSTESGVGYELEPFTVSRTYYSGMEGNEKRPYFVRHKDDNTELQMFITTNNESKPFVVIPVRDYVLGESSTSINSGSSYGQGGDIIK